MDHTDNLQIAFAAGESDPYAPSRTSETPLYCPDCGTPGTGTYCTECGEVLEATLPPVRHYLKEFLHDLLALDSKLIRTVPALLFRPGFLTHEYIAGRRNRYLVPSRLYLLTAFVMFFALGSFLRSQLASATKGTPGSVHYSFGTAQDEDAKKDVQKLLSFAVTTSPYVILLGSTPIFALILKLLYRKKKRLYIEHLIFSFHFFAFALIVFVLGLLISPAYGTLVALALFLLYLFLAMKRVYADRGFGLFTRFFVSTVSYFGIATIAIIVSLLTGYLLGLYTGDLPDLRNVGPNANFHFKNTLEERP